MIETRFRGGARLKTRFLVTVPIFLLLAALAAAGCGTAAQPVVKKIDHVAISSDQTQELFDTLTTMLELPTAWPFASYPGFSTGGVQAGNVNLETLGLGDQATGQPAAAALYGIVLEPYPLDEVLGELGDRGADPSDKQVQTAEMNGQQVPLWTNVTLRALCASDYVVYLCEYTDAAKSALDAHKMSGPLGGMGVVGVAKVVIGSTDTAGLRAAWKKAFAPSTMSSEGLMQLGDGPAVEIVSASTDSIQTLVLEVQSLDTARTFLAGKGLLDGSSNTELRIDPAKVQGLDIRVIQT